MKNLIFSLWPADVISDSRMRNFLGNSIVVRKRRNDLSLEGFLKF